MSGMNENIAALIEESRRNMHEIIDKYYDDFLLRLHGMEVDASNQNVVPIAVDPTRFKREKPSALLFPDGRSVEVRTWRSLAAAILQDCGSIPECRKRLEEHGYLLRGQQRPMLRGDPSALNAPIKVADGLYFEGKHDTEFLLRRIVQVLDLAGYNYSGIAVQLQEPEQEQAVEQVPEEENCGLTQSM